jgi:hypothetical protein
MTSTSALLREVDGLRVAMEQKASAGPRVQLAIKRLQLQEQRVNNMTPAERHADTVRGRASVVWTAYSTQAVVAREWIASANERGTRR